MARVREEAQQHGTREGTLRGLAVTGAVITGAGIVLAGTFGALAVLPLVVLTQIGFIVAFGVLLDTFVVRSVIVPAAVIDVGRRSGGRRSWRKRERGRAIARRGRRQRRALARAAEDAPMPAQRWRSPDARASASARR